MDYNTKKKINDKICKIKDKDVFFKIFNILKTELYNKNGQKKFTQNSNGIFFDLNKISDNSLLKINTLLDEIVNSSESDTPNIKYNTYSSENID